MKKLIILIGFVLLLHSITFGYSITTEIDTVKTNLNELHVGDRVFFDVSIVHDQNSRVEFIPAQPSEMFVILGFSPFTQKMKTDLRTDFQFVSALFDTGLQTIPEQEFIIATDDDSITVYSDSLQVMIYSVLQEDSVALKDIKPPVSLNLKFWDIALPILIIAVIILAIIFITRRKKGLAILPEKKKKVLPAHVIALKKIEQLKLADYIGKGDIKRFYVEISWICREYLENRFHMPFLEMTGYEIRQSLKEIGLEKRLETNAVLQECDKVKFAKYIPPIEDAQKILEDLVDIIHSTKEKEILEEKHED
ncbi:MAG: hypothetical protein JW794_08845 [Candidatus Cloacimonetes bacterium]|nr:hypothetical protein [Candidatus Cloacimonadota bacterium]